MIPFIPLQWQFLAKFILILATACLGGFAGWWVTSDYYQAEFNTLKAANSNAVNAELMRQQKLAGIRAEKSRLAEEQHATDQLSINRLAGDLNGLRVKLARISCGTLPQTDENTANQDRGTGLLYEAADTAFANLQRGDDEDFQRCDQLNIDATQVNAQH